jgi:hypothetical protein
MTDKMEELVKICIQWNIGELDSKEAMYRIYKLFRTEIHPEWLKHNKMDG